MIQKCSSRLWFKVYVTERKVENLPLFWLIKASRMVSLTLQIPLYGELAHVQKYH